MTHIFYRSDFKDTLDGESHFDGLLHSLNIPEKEFDKTDMVEIDVRHFLAQDENGKTIKEDYDV